MSALLRGQAGPDRAEVERRAEERRWWATLDPPERLGKEAIELTFNKRFSNNYQFIASYVFSSLIGNYEGLFRNDNGQSDPNITSLFDLVSLLLVGVLAGVAAA